MKVLLIYPYFLESRPDPADVAPCPIGLYWVAAALVEQGHQVEILNWFTQEMLPPSLEDFFRDRRPDLIGFSVLNANRWGAVEIARIARQVVPAAKIVFGGVGATCLWRHLLEQHPEIDGIVLGEGERTLVNLAERWATGESGGLDGIAGLAWRRDGVPHAVEPAAPIADLDALPLPARNFSYRHLSLTRGCPWDCRFCGSPEIWGRRVRFRSGDHFVAELLLLYRRGVRFFYFSDDTFTIDKQRVIEISKKILALKMRITWVAISRVTYVDEEMLYWMRVAGCIQISYGVESGSERIRAVLNKKIKRDEIVRAFALTTRYGILPRAYFIYGSPGEDWNSINETLDLIREIKPLAAIFYVLDIFPGTALYRDFCRRAGAGDEIWGQRIEDLMYCQTDPDLPEQRVLEFGDRLRRSYHEWLPGFAEAIELVDRRELYPFHADFLARLALTFSHGDYARKVPVRLRDATAERLYLRALNYYPDANALLGLAVLRQQRGAHGEVVDLLREHLANYGDHEALNVCFGISLMQLGRHREALDHFLPFTQSRQAMTHAAECWRALGDAAQARSCLDRARALSEAAGGAAA